MNCVCPECGSDDVFYTVYRMNENGWKTSDHIQTFGFCDDCMYEGKPESFGSKLYE